MARAFIILLDSFGIGSVDAGGGEDVGADTLRHVAEYCHLNNHALRLPNLTRLGLNCAAMISKGLPVPGLALDHEINAAYGCAAPLSYGKDTTSGHWELAGVPVFSKWGHYTSFPAELIENLIQGANLTGILGNKASSGTEIINELGQEHQRSNKPIIYTSADSVLQIAAHEESFGLARLYNLAEFAREISTKFNIARVIARPFIGNPGCYLRTSGRRDYSLAPPELTLLDHMVAQGRRVYAIGKVADIYAHRGITDNIAAYGNANLFNKFIEVAVHAASGSLVFVNLVDFDTLYGHRRDILGYANALMEFDAMLPAFEQLLQTGDLAIITADHGCDPSWPGSDHTREYVPILAFGPGIKTQSIGKRSSFADIGQTIAHHLGMPALEYGIDFLN